MTRFFRPALLLALAAPALLAGCQTPAPGSTTAAAAPSAGPTMQASPGVADATRQILAAFQNNDAAAIRAAFAESDALVAIGTDPAEYIRGYAQTTDTFTQQAAALTGLTIDPGQIDAYEQGDIGWSASRTTFRFADSTKVPVRLTTVFAREGGDWRVVQWHGSVGVGNEDTAGFDGLPQ